ncbi:hypothetical protein [Sphaerisporangium dianthi]|uniref:SMI1/KNR4 family protein n=1 Tax=Sphaerisporangium dianthi TaxID=1436120 RepID=A0ABV9CRS0_9ACTN
MTRAGLAEIAETVAGLALTFVEPGSAEVTRFPESWRPIARSSDPAHRHRSALALWSREFLDLVPRFAGALETRFFDVRAGVTGDRPVLVYVAEAEDGGYVSWIGYDPRDFGEPPPFWESFPGPLRVFLREVHAGFVSGRQAAFGPARPVSMDTLANLADYPDGVPGWEDAEMSTTRLVQIATDGGHLYYCLSPDLSPGEIALIYEGDIDRQDFSAQLDELMMSRLEDPG